MIFDVGTVLAALSLEAAALMAFAAGIVCGSLLTCCCLSRCGEHAELNSRLRKGPGFFQCPFLWGFVKRHIYPRD